MPGLNTAQIKGMARDVLGHDISESQAQQLLESAWDQSQWGADEGQVRGILNSIKVSEQSQPPSAQDAVEQLENKIADAANELLRYMNDYQLALTPEEEDKFLEKAIEQVKPYYEKKRKEIEQGIEEGRIRNANQLLMELRDVEQDIQGQLKKYDIREAETEEDFANTMADITATKEENLEAKRMDWRDRIRSAKESQVASGTLTSGVGRSRIGELLERQEFEEGTIKRRAAQAETEAETARKYDLQEIALAREQAEKERVRKLGTPSELEETRGELVETAGYDSYGDVPSDIEILRRRAERDITPYRKEELTDLEERQREAEESRRRELREEEMVLRQKEYQKALQKKAADLGEKYRVASTSLLKYV